MGKPYRGRGENIERIFYDDVRDKKRTGANIFKRVSSRKGGSKYVSPYANLKPKEIKQMSGDVVVFNIYETLMPIEKFTTRPKEQQIAIMRKWREKFQNNEIIKGLACSKPNYYKLLDELGLKNEYKPRVEAKRVGVNNGRVFNLEIDITKYRDEVIDIATFKQLSIVDRATLLLHYLETYTVIELSKFWEVDNQYIHTLKYRFNNDVKKGKYELKNLNKAEITEDNVEVIEESEQQELLTDNEIEEVVEDVPVEMVEEVETIIEQPIINTPIKSEPIAIESPQDFSTINIQITEELTPMEMLQKVQAMSFLLDSNKKYKFQFKVGN
jgi:hypothetical protein